MKKNQEAISEKLLTDVELELMSILWRLTEGSVNDVLANLEQGRHLAYTSVSTILRILEQKKIVKTRKEGRGHVYIPILQKPEYEAQSVNHMIHRVFEGEPVSLVKHLIDSQNLNAQDLREIQILLKNAQVNK